MFFREQCSVAEVEETGAFMPSPDIVLIRITISAAFSCLFVVFGFFSGPEITLPEQGEATILNIGFIKGGNEQQLTGIDRRNIARFGISVAGSASKWKIVNCINRTRNGCNCIN